MRVSSRMLAHSRYFAQWLVLLLTLNGSHASNPVLPTNSYDAHIRNLLLAGKVPEALNYAKEQYGRIPAYLNQYAAAFRVDNQKVGQCQEVARSIHAALSNLGAKAEYLAIRVKWDHPLFKLKDGTEKVLSFNGNHFVVKVEGMVYDAYTGVAGMKIEAYLAQIVVPPGFKIMTEVVSKP